MRTSTISFSLVFSFALLALAGCESNSLSLGVGDAGGLPPSDGVSDVFRMRVGTSIDVSPSLNHPEIEGSTTVPVATLTSDDAAIVTITPTASGFTLHAVAVGDTVVHGKGDGVILGPQYEGDLPIRVIP
jgi:hypothetical protein